MLAHNSNSSPEACVGASGLRFPWGSSIPQGTMHRHLIAARVILPSGAV